MLYIKLGILILIYINKKENMEQSTNYLNETFNTIKTWFFKNGLTGIGGLIIGIILFIFGFKFYSGIAFGVFGTRNWDIIVDYIKSLIIKSKEETEKKETE